MLNNVQKRGIRYSEEFKQQVNELYRSDQPVLNLSCEYSVATVTICKWIKQFLMTQVSDNEGINAKEYQAMKKRFAELKIENEILKKLPPYSHENDRRNCCIHQKIKSSIYRKINLRSFKIL